MALKIIKHRLFHWFEEVDSSVVPGERGYVERLNHLGEEVDVTNPAYLKRGEDLDAFYTDDEAKAIKAGSYRGDDAGIVYNSRQNLGIQQSPMNAPTPDSPEADPSTMDAVALAEFITQNRLNAEQTVALAGDDEDSINKVLDAENIATNNEPRKSVIEPLERKLTDATT